VAAGLLVFILSLDDFLIAFFCAGTSAQTLSLYIYAMIRTGVSPVINALATCMVVVSSVLVVAFCSLRVRARVW
jgi:spermidine/putrescine transport system permease protein